MRRSSLPTLLVLSLAFAVPRVGAAGNEPASVEERLRRLEATVDTLQQENARLRQQVGEPAAAPTKAAPLPILAPAGHETRLVIGGFAQVQAEFGDAGDDRFAGTNDRFYVRRARLYAAGSFAEQFDFKVEGEFGANTIAPTGGLKASGNEIYIGWKRFPAAIVRVGQLKPAFGGEQLAPETKSITVERYLGNDRLTDQRQIGASVGGDVTDWLSYLLVVGNGNGSNTSANDNNKFMQTGRLAAVAFDRVDLGRLVVGVNGMYSDDAAVSRPGLGFRSSANGAVDNVFAGKRRGWGADAVWHRGLLDVSAELLRMHFSPRDRLPASNFEAQGWELIAGYFVVPQTLEAVVRRESFDPNLDVTGDQTNNWVVGLNYLIHGEDLRLVVDYLFGHDATAPNDHGRVLTRLQVIF